MPGGGASGLRLAGDPSDDLAAGPGSPDSARLPTGDLGERRYGRPRTCGGAEGSGLLAFDDQSDIVLSSRAWPSFWCASSMKI